MSCHEPAASGDRRDTSSGQPLSLVGEQVNQNVVLVTDHPPHGRTRNHPMEHRVIEGVTVADVANDPFERRRQHQHAEHVVAPVRLRGQLRPR